MYPCGGWGGLIVRTFDKEEQEAQIQQSGQFHSCHLFEFHSCRLIDRFECTHG
jgi:hypothetical protein